MSILSVAINIILPNLLNMLNLTPVASADVPPAFAGKSGQTWRYETPDLLRIASADDLDNGDTQAAISMARRAVALEPGNALNHTVLARALTQRFKLETPDDSQLFDQCLAEWSFVRANGHDSFERDEAINQILDLKFNRGVAHCKEKLKEKYRHNTKSVHAEVMPVPAREAK